MDPVVLSALFGSTGVLAVLVKGWFDHRNKRDDVTDLRETAVWKRMVAQVDTATSDAAGARQDAHAARTESTAARIMAAKSEANEVICRSELASMKLRLTILDSQMTALQQTAKEARNG